MLSFHSLMEMWQCRLFDREEKANVGEEAPRTSSSVGVEASQTSSSAGEEAPETSVSVGEEAPQARGSAGGETPQTSASRVWEEALLTGANAGEEAPQTIQKLEDEALEEVDLKNCTGYEEEECDVLSSAHMSVTDEVEAETIEDEYQLPDCSDKDHESGVYHARWCMTSQETTETEEEEHWRVDNSEDDQEYIVHYANHSVGYLTESATFDDQLCTTDDSENGQDYMLHQPSSQLINLEEAEKVDKNHSITRCKEADPRCGIEQASKVESKTKNGKHYSPTIQEQKEDQSFRQLMINLILEAKARNKKRCLTCCREAYKNNELLQAYISEIDNTESELLDKQHNTTYYLQKYLEYARPRDSKRVIVAEEPKAENEQNCSTDGSQNDQEYEVGKTSCSSIGQIKIETENVLHSTTHSSNTYQKYIVCELPCYKDSESTMIYSVGDETDHDEHEPHQNADVTIFDSNLRRASATTRKTILGDDSSLLQVYVNLVRINEDMVSVNLTKICTNSSTETCSDITIDGCSGDGENEAIREDKGAGRCQSHEDSAEEACRRPTKGHYGFYPIDASTPKRRKSQETH